MSKDSSSLPSTHSKLWKVSATESEESAPICQNCVNNAYIIAELENELRLERKSMDETILLVEKMESEHKKIVDDLKVRLNLEKDRVIALEKTNEMERKARMEDIYKHEKQTRNFEYISKEYERIQKKNSDMLIELEHLHNENIALSGNVNQNQAKKEAVVIELKNYESQVASLDDYNNELRSRLYRAEVENSKLQVLYSKLQKKYENSLRGLAPCVRNPRSKKSQERSLGHATTTINHSDEGTLASQFTYKPNDSTYSDFSALNSKSISSNISMNYHLGEKSPNADLILGRVSHKLQSSKGRISELSYVNLVKRIHQSDIGIARSKSEHSALWPVK
jgi:chromosome segregation ATPase